MKREDDGWCHRDWAQRPFTPTNDVVGAGQQSGHREEVHTPRKERHGPSGGRRDRRTAALGCIGVTKRYQDIPVNEQVEVLMLAGDIAWKEDGEPVIHAHVVVGRQDGSTRGGHLKKAIVRPTLELVLEEFEDDPEGDFLASPACGHPAPFW